MVNYPRNYYEVLGLSPKATAEEIRNAYIKLAKLHHPDHNIDNTNDRRMIELNQIYEVLSNPIRKQEYDARFKPEQTYDFTKVRTNTTPVPQQKRKVIRYKDSTSHRFKNILLGILWTFTAYLCLYFIVNIIALFITLPTRLLSWFPA